MLVNQMIKVMELSSPIEGATHVILLDEESLCKIAAIFEKQAAKDYPSKLGDSACYEANFYRYYKKKQYCVQEVGYQREVVVQFILKE